MTADAPAPTTPSPRSGGLWSRSALLGAVVFSLLLGHPTSIRGQTPGLEALACQTADEGGVVCQIDARDQFDQEVVDLLENGFTNELVYRVYLFPDADDEPVAATVVIFAVRFQLYTDVFFISREGVEGYLEVSNLTSVVDRLARFEVALDADLELPAGEYFAVTVLEVNPVNEAQLVEARRWIARSRGGYRFFDQSDSSLFGPLLSLFVNAEPGSADARRVFRSDTFELSP